MMARTLTLADIARLGEQFREVSHEKFVSSFVCILDYDEDDPFTKEGWFSHLSNGKKVTLALHSWGPCQFLLNNLCFVHKYRPWMCRMYPFWFNPDLRVRDTSKIYCKSLSKLNSPLPSKYLKDCAKLATTERDETLSFFKRFDRKCDADEFVKKVDTGVKNALKGALENQKNWEILK